MDQKKPKKVYVIGHKNPDTDSICSAIAYANLKNKITGEKYIAKRAGEVNGETAYVLDKFQVSVPSLLDNVHLQVKDMDIRHIEGVSDHMSIKDAWARMKDENIKTLPVTRGEKLEGLITIGDIATSYMEVYDNNILATARTQYRNIVKTLDGTLISGNEHGYFLNGKVVIAASSPDLMENFIEKDDLVILGNRYESQLCAIEMGASCIIVCEGAGVSMTIKKLAQERGCTVITTPYDTYTAARLINQSMPISYFMKTEKLITFDTDDFIDDIKDVMASKRFRHFPVLDKEGKYKGLISRRNLLGARGKNVILVDHNERGQAVDGIENANILELIDHHRLGTVETVGPVFFRNQPLGCTATIIFQMYREQGLEIDKTIAGLLCSAIISDTLLFRSPTCTPMDRAAAVSLAEMAGIKLDEFANQMFEAGSELKGKSDAEILYLDFKKFSAGKTNFGVGQINSLNAEELGKLKNRMLPFMEKAREDEGLDMIFFMLTNILTETTELLCVGQGAAQVVADAFHVGDANEELKQTATLPGVVSGTDSDTGAVNQVTVRGRDCFIRKIQ